MIRWLIRLVLLPIMIVLTVLEWCGTHVVQFSGIFCRFIAGMIFALVIIGFATGLGLIEHLIKMLVVGFIFSLIPQIEGAIISAIARAHIALMNLTGISS